MSAVGEDRKRLLGDIELLDGLGAEALADEIRWVEVPAELDREGFERVIARHPEALLSLSRRIAARLVSDMPRRELEPASTEDDGRGHAHRLHPPPVPRNRRRRPPHRARPHLAGDRRGPMMMVVRVSGVVE